MRIWRIFDAVGNADSDGKGRRVMRKLAVLDWLRNTRYGQVVAGICLALAIALFWYLWNNSGRFALAVMAFSILPVIYLLFKYPILGTMLSLTVITSDAEVLFAPLDTLVPLVVLGILVLRKLYLRDPTWRMTPFIGWSLLLFLWHFISTLWAPDLEYGWIGYHYAPAILMLIIAETIRTREDFRYLVLAASLGLLITGVSAVYSAATALLTGLSITARHSATGISELRFYGHWKFANAMAYTMMTFVGLAIVFIRRDEKLLIRLLLIGAAGAALIAVLLSISRGGLLTTALVVGILALGMRYRWILLSCAVGAVVIVMLVFPLRLFGRLEALTQGGDSSTSERAVFFSSGIEMINDSFPLGLGAGGMIDRSMGYMLHRLGPAACHDTYLDLLGDMGLVGLILFVGMLLSLVGPLRSRPPRERDDDLHRMVRLAFQVGSAGILIGMMFEDSIGFTPYWIFLTLASLRPVLFDRLEALPAA
jgi:O-antigen ligase